MFRFHACFPAKGGKPQLTRSCQDHRDPSREICKEKSGLEARDLPVVRAHVGEALTTSGEYTLLRVGVSTL